jgi:hypothetical protein
MLQSREQLALGNRNTPREPYVANSFKRSAVFVTGAWNESIKAEWEKHQSAFARTWFVSMLSLRKIRIVPDEADEQFQGAIRDHSTDAGVVEAMLKDAHLIEAARLTDFRVAAVLEGDACIVWFESGAEEEKSRLLHPPTTV